MVVLARVEVAQESHDEEMNEACVTNNAENVKPRTDESRDDSTEVTSRMEDGLVSVEVSSRSEGVLPSRKRGSKEGGLPKDAMLEYGDVSKMCINEMTVIFKLLDLVSANERVAESVSVRFGDSAVDIGFERGIVADYATGWMNGNVEVVCDGAASLVGRRTTVCGPDEAMKQALAASSAKEACAASNAKGVLAASSKMTVSAASDVDVVEKDQMGGEMCCITMIKSQNVAERHVRRPGGQGVMTTTMRDVYRVGEVKYKNFVEQCLRHLEKKEMCQVLGSAGKPFLHENLWDRWSRGLGFVKKMAEVMGCTKRRVSCADLS